MVVSGMQCAIIIYIMFLVDFSVSNAVVYSRHVRQAATTEAAIVGTTPKEHRECHNFELQMGLSFRNYHSCCESDATSTSIGTTSRPPVCATSFSDKDQVFNCKPSKTSYLEPNITNTFHCAGCLGQTWAKDKCSSRWFWLGKSTVSCWVMSECFKGACQSQEEQFQIGNEIPIDITFCGDGLCEDDKNETKRTCPLDCCSVENPKKCAISDNKCPDICCSDEHCCDIPASSLIADNVWIFILLGFFGVCVFINVLCCCCCCCMYDKCCTVMKKRRRMKALRKNCKRSSVPLNDAGFEYVNSTRPISSSNM